ncbi:MAG: cyclic pyranopterin monophosphate synthase MoaC [Deltaproteobacteria bacterium]|nr:MAG: cyclic pyranopterin monophosphate synthase MoaC [Deltaproteobacteria bacterium]RLC14421.1 MAG: cyclic pyranopterin monophosphate synthase MoaC [Deltaproteobacteria bacterium]
MSDFSHVDSKGRVRMVDVTEKKPSLRKALAQAVVHMQPDTFDRIIAQNVKKGNVLETARIAGILAAKKTSSLIPMCHPLNITHAQIDFFPDKQKHEIRIEALMRIVDQTGIEMEALTAVCISALTIYDMCKSLDKNIHISNICLLKKSGGKSGDFVRRKTPDMDK